MTYAPFVIVLTTLPADDDVDAFALTLVNERLAACVNVLPAMSSTYRWQGSVERASERQLIIKTTRATLDRLTSRLTQLHPYDVPEIVVLQTVEAGEVYVKWLEGAVTSVPEQ